ncbi:excalibur calcium-binding domain-containing protein [Deinococcus sp. HMF7604]|uniref:excalibur calcium-binding domain-containing protein n=1 Tax=Deinococcus betulae TaxID=2873312 RepID=UPI001CCAE761|nr:excalibur calcium-binding domain-containing protein [Deinococcus betulae]
MSRLRLWSIKRQPVKKLPFLSVASADPIPAGGFKSCKAVAAAGYWNSKRGRPAYHPRLDRDRDRLACER